MAEIEHWLAQHGLERFSDTFVQNEVSVADLPDLTEADLRELGLPLGPRKQFLRAIRAQVSPPESTAATDPSGEAERRQLTVMFADLVGSTALSRQLDVEDLRHVNRAYQEVAGAAITHFGGFVARYMGDGVLAYFGYPVAHEDDAERAVRAGLSLTTEVANLEVPVESQEAVQLAVRVGIATGPVVVGELIGAGVAQECTVVGETPNLAARLQSTAHPGTVVVAPSTYRLTDRLFNYKSDGEQNFSGIDEPVEVWRAVAERRVQSRFRATRARHLTELVGRDDELALLTRRWDSALHGEGHAVLLSGEAGIGKSRLAEALHEHVAASSHVWLSYQCSPYQQASPFHPFIAQLDYAADLSAAPDLHTKRERLMRLLARVQGASDEDFEALSGLVGLSDNTSRAWGALNPQAKKNRIVSALSKQFRGLTLEAPVLCVFEDIHWADASTLEVLDPLIGELEGLRALMVFTFRPEFTPSWAGQACTTQISLGRMSARDSRRMVEAAFRGIRLAPEVAEELAARGDGVPLFIEELTQAAVDRAGLSSDCLNSNVQDSGIPDTLMDVLMARLDRSVKAREAAQVASVIGRDFPFSVLVNASGASDSALREAITQLTDSGLVQIRGQLPDALCRFRHTLIRDAAYATLTRERREDLHLRVARALSTQARGDERSTPEVLAYHLKEGHQYEEAAAHYREATERARDQYANVELIVHAHHGLEALTHCEPSQERDQTELTFHFALALGYRFARGFNSKEAMRTFESALEVARRCDDIDAEVQCVRGLYNYHFVRGEYHSSDELLEETLRRTQIRGTPFHRAYVVSVIGSRELYTGNVTKGREWLCKALETKIDDPVMGPTMQVLDVNTAASMNLSWALWLQGDTSLALEKSEAALASAAATQNPFPSAISHVWAGGLAYTMGDRDRLARIVERLENLIEDYELPVWNARTRFLGGLLTAMDGCPSDGVPLMDRALRELRLAESRLFWTWLCAQFAEVNLKIGAVDKAVGLLNEGLDHAKENAERYWLPELHRLRGKVELLQPNGSTIEAARYFETALGIAHEQDSPALELRAALTLARLHIDAGDDEAASAILAGPLTAVDNGLASSDLEAARLLLGQ